jgi:hypothetical protein
MQRLRPGMLVWLVRKPSNTLVGNSKRPPPTETTRRRRVQHPCAAFGELETGGFVDNDPVCETLNEFESEPEHGHSTPTERDGSSLHAVCH